LPSLAPCFDPDALAGADPGPPEARAALDEARVLALVGEHEAAWQKATRVFERAGLDALRVEALAVLGRLAFVRGAAADGRKHLEQALDDALAGRDDELVADVSRALAEFTRDDFHARLATAAAERLRDPPRLAASARVRAEIVMAASEHRTAQSLLDRALERVGDSPATAARIELQLARIAAAQGRPEQAGAHVDRALALAADLPRHPVLADALVERAHLERDAGRHARARLRLGEALAIHAALPDHDAALARLHLELADLAATDGQDGHAYDHYRAAIAATGRTPDALPRHQLTRARDALAHLLERTHRSGHGAAPPHPPAPR
jgi:tetratricopeptide (TPR) repeat protein